MLIGAEKQFPKETFSLKKICMDRIPILLVADIQKTF
jgi:hypothetical protein